MNNSELTVMSMVWLVENAPAVAVVLWAAAPVVALAVAGYAIHVVGRRNDRGKK